MPNLVPGVIWRPIPIDYSRRPKRLKGRGLIGHIAVSDSADLRGNPNGVCWTFYLPYVGPAIQQIDLDYVSGSSKSGDATCATFESQGGLGPIVEVNKQRWSANQIEWAARILAHMHLTEGVPLQVMPDSRPESRGFATHRLGIDPYRVAGGEVWSSSYAKACPGDARHAQRAEIVELARKIASGGNPTAATPEPIPLGDDDMRVLRDNRGTIYLDTGYELQATGSLALAGLWSRRYGDAIQFTEGEIGMARADNEARLARLLTLLAKSAGGDVDEAQIVAGLIPAIAEAVAGKTGATREEIAELLAGITLRAS